MLNPQMIYSKAGEKLTEGFEGFRSLPYQDQGGKWTQGYGRAIGIGPTSPVIDRATAQAWLEEDIAWAEKVVNEKVNVKLDQSQFDALVDFVYNIGAGNFEGSTLLKDLNSGDFDLAAGQFEVWDHCGGKEVAGLLRRRQAEEQEFETKSQPQTVVEPSEV